MAVGKSPNIVIIGGGIATTDIMSGAVEMIVDNSLKAVIVITDRVAEDSRIIIAARVDIATMGITTGAGANRGVGLPWGITGIMDITTGTPGAIIITATITRGDSILPAVGLGSAPRWRACQDVRKVDSTVDATIHRRVATVPPRPRSMNCGTRSNSCKSNRSNSPRLCSRSGRRSTRSREIKPRVISIAC